LHKRRNVTDHLPRRCAPRSTGVSPLRSPTSTRPPGCARPTCSPKSSSSPAPMQLHRFGEGLDKSSPSRASVPVPPCAGRRRQPTRSSRWISIAGTTAHVKNWQDGRCSSGGPPSRCSKPNALSAASMVTANCQPSPRSHAHRSTATLSHTRVHPHRSLNHRITVGTSTSNGHPCDETRIGVSFASSFCPIERVELFVRIRRVAAVVVGLTLTGGC
jgi:hypothetical protein